MQVDAAVNERAALGRHEGRNVEDASLHLLEQSAQVVVVEWKRALHQKTPKDTYTHRLTDSMMDERAHPSTEHLLM